MGRVATKKPVLSGSRRARISGERAQPSPTTEEVSDGGRREQNKLDKRLRIRDSAAALFVELGYGPTTTRMIAERAGVAAGTLFLYADDKQDLMFLVFHDRLQAAAERQTRSLPRNAPLIERLLHLFRGIFAMYAETPALSAEFIKTLPGSKGRNAAEVNALTFAFIATLANLVREGKERGEVDPSVDALMAARNVFSLYFGSLMSWLMGLAPTMESALDPILKDSLLLQIRGLAARA